MLRYAHEVFEQVAKAKGKPAKIKLLRENDNMVVRTILFATFSDRVTFLLPEGRPPFTLAEAHNHPTDLKRQLGEIKYFIKGGVGDRMIKFKREQKFIQLLEGVHPKDAEVILTMVSKQSPAAGVDANLVKEAFPDLLK